MTTPLFGGAVEMALPPDYRDMSNFRGIPDNQEVWASANETHSIIVDIVEQLESESFETALQSHYQEIGKENRSLSNKYLHVQIGPEVCPSLAKHLDESPAQSAGFQIGVVDGLQTLSDPLGQPTETLRLTMVLLRLPKYHTDILFELNLPTEPATQADFTGDFLRKVVDTFRIREWRLFE